MGFSQVQCDQTGTLVDGRSIKTTRLSIEKRALKVERKTHFFKQSFFLNCQKLRVERVYWSKVWLSVFTILALSVFLLHGLHGRANYKA